MKWRYIQNISEHAAHAQIGMKAYNLHRLANAGFPLPQGYVIRESGYRDFIARNYLRHKIKKCISGTILENRWQSRAIPEMILKGAFPTALEMELREIVRLHPGVRWAVRSSSTAEDLKDASFAGMYESYLDIEGYEELVVSIKKCWASLWSPNALAYRGRHNIDNMQASMAVVLQEMVNARFAGVIFTRNPASRGDEICMEYCRGNAEKLVSGKISPWACTIRRKGLAIVKNSSPDKRGLEKRRIKELAGISLKVEQHFGGPQDIEWAFEDDRFYLLQSRHITTTSQLAQEDAGLVWTRANIGEVLPRPVTPLTWHVFLATLLGRPELVIESDRDIVENRIEGIRLIHGRAYIRLIDFLNSFCYLPFVTPEIMNSVLGLPLPAGSFPYRKPADNAVRIAQALFFLNVLGIVPRLETMIKMLPPLPFPGIENLQDLIKWNTECFRLHLKATAYDIAAFAVISRLLASSLPDEKPGALSVILTGREDLQTVAQGYDLWSIAESVRTLPAVRSVLMKAGNWMQAEKRLMKVEGGADVVARFRAFLDANGARAAGEFELSVPRWIEEPDFPLVVLRQYLATSSSSSSATEALRERKARRDETVADIEKRLGFASRMVFRRLLASYSAFATMRENMKYRLMQGSFALRKVFLSIGEKLHRQGVLANPEDIFYLTPREGLDLYIREGAVANVKGIVRRRKSDIAMHEKREAREIITADGGKISDDMSTGRIRGTGCGPGVVEGIARVLEDIGQAHLFRPGEILVTHHTDPGWTPLFLVCGGLVTEIGGFLSHGATVAREYGIPAVVNAAGAMKKIGNGDILRVDGTHGLVFIK